MHVLILGCGQLARMMALQGMPMGLRFSFVNPAGSHCVEGLGPVHEWSAFADPEQASAILQDVDVVTYEREDLTISDIRARLGSVPVAPTLDALHLCQNRLREKDYLASLGLPVGEHREVTSRQGLTQAIEALGFPLYLKSAEKSFDGRGQWHLHEPPDEQTLAEIEAAMPIIAEAHVPFLQEFSVVAVRNREGDFQPYPVTQNHHEAGILVTSQAPAPDVKKATAEQAVAAARKVMDSLDYVGVMAMECFDVGEQWVINELAPRVHNSGHWTWPGAKTGQFENHVRAVCGLPLGATDVHGAAGMVNILGQYPKLEAVLGPHCYAHFYNKGERFKRKIGHVSITHDDPDWVAEKVAGLCAQNLCPVK